jgi:hypothetical protein
MENAFCILWNASCLQHERPGAESILSAHNYANNVPVKFIEYEGIDIDQADVQAIGTAIYCLWYVTPKSKQWGVKYKIITEVKTTT